MSNFRKICTPPLVPPLKNASPETPRATELSLEALAAQLLQVTIQLGLEWFVGLGVGAGANVLLRYACDHPDKIAGLILANPSADQAGEESSLNYGIDVGNVFSLFLPFWN